MSWFVLIFVCAFLFSLVNIIDKFFCGKKFKSVYTLAVLSTFLNVFFVSTLIPFAKFSWQWNWPLFAAIISGPVYVLLWLFWWKGLTTTEISRSTAIYNSSPIFTALMAVLLLGEKLSSLQWGAIIIIIVGAILCSWEKNSSNGRFNTAYLLIIIAALCSSVGSLLSKTAVTHINPLAVYIISAYAGAPFFLLLLIKKEVKEEAKNAIKNRNLLGALIIRGLIGFAGVIFFYLALFSGPVSLVSAVYGITPLLVFVNLIIISRFLPKLIHEDLSRQALLAKGIAIILTVVGVVLINF